MGHIRVYILTLPPRILATGLLSLAFWQADWSAYFIHRLIGAGSSYFGSISGRDFRNLAANCCRHQIYTFAILLLFALVLSLIPRVQPWIFWATLIGVYFLGFMADWLPALSLPHYWRQGSLRAVDDIVRLTGDYAFFVGLIAPIFPMIACRWAFRMIDRAWYARMDWPMAMIDSSEFRKTATWRLIASVPVAFAVMMGCFWAASGMRQAIFPALPLQHSTSLVIIYVFVMIGCAIEISVNRPTGGRHLLFTVLLILLVGAMAPDVTALPALPLPGIGPNLFWFASLAYLILCGVGVNLLSLCLRWPTRSGSVA